LLSAAKRRPKIARSFNCGIRGKKPSSPDRDGRNFLQKISTAPPGLEIILHPNPQLKLRAIFSCASGAF
jgi:hypothetical protein